MDLRPSLVFSPLSDRERGGVEKLYKVGEGEGRGDEGESVDNFVLSKRM